jgi:hypothetical protein
MSRGTGVFIVACCSILGVWGCGQSQPGARGAGGTTGRGGSSGSGGSGGGAGSVQGGASGSGGTTPGGGTMGDGGSGAGRGGAGGGAGGAGSGGIGTGGAGGKGGAGVGGSTGSGGAGGTSACISHSSMLSADIATVGIVTWSTTLSEPTSAHIDFGLTTSYGMTAPVAKPTASDNRTLLLGMKANKPYHYRITVIGAGGECTSDDYTLTTKSLPSGLPKITPTYSGDKSKLFGGFLITGQYVSGPSTTGSPAYILDGDGDIVWAYNSGVAQVTGVKMSYDGNSMWINTANVGSGAKLAVYRVSMDGSKREDLTDNFTGLNHQLTVLPDETVAFYAYNDSSHCEDLKLYPPGGPTRTVVNSGKAQGGATECHLNNIQYSDSDQSLVFSDLDNQVVVKVKIADGSTAWVLNGGAKATLSGITWNGSQHGIHLLGEDRLMLFTNNMRKYSGTGDGSIALEIELDVPGKTGRKVWSYKANPGIQNDVMGDVQRLPNGNTVIAYSTKGVIQEVDADGNLLSDWSFPLGAQFGYIEKRATLYGPPPR